MRDTFDMDRLIQRIVKENRAEPIAQSLQAADPEIKAVWGFGSTYETGQPYRLDADIDLAIEGGDVLALSDDPFSRMVRERGVRLI